ncbi:MAG: type II toxin-antitoxin system HipA family toxin YjjJ [Ignavibacteriae bacterium]|nr:type II toxin-antitoxin system HipA family toxin YjjJ [Ignavibacteriota bacterium]
MPVSLLSALGNGFRTAPELCRVLGVSQPTLSRLLRAEGDAVIRLGKARATRYARAAAVFGRELSYNIYRVNRSGKCTQAGVLRALRDGRFLVQADGTQAWLLGEGGDGLYPGLPYFLEDLRPGGFLGRSIARRLADLRGYPEDTQVWSADLVGSYLLDFGEEAPGDVLIGEGACARAARPPGLVLRSRDVDYPVFAARSMREGLPGPSAGGEQPKFTVYDEEAGHLIVKFSPAGAGSEARRWRDLLLAEAAALATLRSHGFPAADTAVCTFGGRVFLESRRFDRSGEMGRVPTLSLQSVSTEYTGDMSSWRGSAEALVGRGVLSASDAARIAELALFGAWIGNTDMHGANLAVRPKGSAFTVHPIYDMLPMAWAPRRGELPPVSYTAPSAERYESARWSATGALAEAYWADLENNTMVSDSFRRIAGAVLKQVRRALAGG